MSLEISSAYMVAALEASVHTYARSKFLNAVTQSHSRLKELYPDAIDLPFIEAVAQFVSADSGVIKEANEAIGAIVKDDPVAAGHALAVAKKFRQTQGRQKDAFWIEQSVAQECPQAFETRFISNLVKSVVTPDSKDERTSALWLLNPILAKRHEVITPGLIKKLVATYATMEEDPIQVRQTLGTALKQKPQFYRLAVETLSAGMINGEWPTSQRPFQAVFSLAQGGEAHFTPDLAKYVAQNTITNHDTNTINFAKGALEMLLGKRPEFVESVRPVLKNAIKHKNADIRTLGYATLFSLGRVPSESNHISGCPAIFDKDLVRVIAHAAKHDSEPKIQMDTYRVWGRVADCRPELISKPALTVAANDALYNPTEAICHYAFETLQIMVMAHPQWLDQLTYQCVVDASEKLEKEGIASFINIVIDKRPELIDAPTLSFLTAAGSDGENWKVSQSAAKALHTIIAKRPDLAADIFALALLFTEAPEDSTRLSAYQMIRPIFETRPEFATEALVDRLLKDTASTANGLLSQIAYQIIDMLNLRKEDAETIIDPDRPLRELTHQILHLGK